MQSLSSRRRRTAVRRGSVLIMVIAVLVLMALIGTAYVSVARIDRQAAATGSANVQVNLLNSSVTQEVNSFILNGVFATVNSENLYRPVTDDTGSHTPLTIGIQSSDANALYHDYDSPLDDHEAWLASRVPQQVDVTNATITHPGGANPIVWPAVSMLTTTSFNVAGYPIYEPSNGTTPIATLGGASGSGLGSATSKKQYRFEPTTTTLVAGGTAYPAFNIYTVTSTLAPTITNPGTVMAADADGDGIADSLYYLSPNQPDPGITYYYGVRIIDNNSAINASTAWSVATDFDGATSPPAGPVIITPNPGFFASNVGLQELLRSYINTTSPPTSTEMDSLTGYRFNSTTITQASLYDLTKSSYPPQAEPYDDPSSLNNWSSSGGVRNDYQYITYGDMLQMNLARRPENPAYSAMSGSLRTFQPLSWSDSAALAYHFCIPASNTPSSSIETLLKQSLLEGVGSSGATTYSIGPSDTSPSAYPSTTPDLVAPNPYSTNTNSKTKNAAGQGYWYTDNFDFDDVSELSTTAPVASAASCRPLRALIVARNPVSDNVPWDTSIVWNPTAAIAGTQMTNGVANVPPTRANLNTSNYTDLYNAFLAVMNRCDDSKYSPFRDIKNNAGLLVVSGSGTPATPGAPLANTDVQKLRAAIATVNTLTMRSPAYHTPNYLYSGIITGAPNTDYQTITTTGSNKVNIYGMSPQPFITQVIAYDSSASSSAYLAIKLFNPTSLAIDLGTTTWQFVTFDPSASAGSQFATLYTFGGAAESIPAGGFLWVTSNTAPPKPNFLGPPAGPNAPVGLYAPTGVNGGTNTLDSAVTGQKMVVLIRPVPGKTILLSDPTTFAPVDQVDFSAIGTNTAGSAGSVQFRSFVYTRAQTAWGCVFPSTAPQATTATGTSWAVKTYAFANPLPTATNYNSQFANPSNAAANSTTPIYGTDYQVPLGFDLISYPGPSPVSAVPYKFPYGAFARDGDAFKIPFVGSYMVTDASTPPKVLLVNSVSYDSSAAWDGDASDNETGIPGGVQLIGQFCPVGSPTAIANAANINDYDDSSADTAKHSSYFARFLLDYVGATNTPNSDYAPNVDPLGGKVTNVHAVPNNPNLRPTQTTAEQATSDFSHVANHTNTGTIYNNEYDQPNEGLININTAPWPVLAMLPMVTDNNPTDPAATKSLAMANNILLAKAIVKYRDANGPFTSIFDLNKVPNFYNGYTTLGTMLNGDTNKAGPNERDYTNLPSPPSPSLARSDDSGAANFSYYAAKDRLNMITRISNLITTRSDSFTVYVVVEGWKNAGTSSATRVSQVRQAYIVDRSRVSGINKALNIIPVPN